MNTQIKTAYHFNYCYQFETFYPSLALLLHILNLSKVWRNKYNSNGSMFRVWIGPFPIFLLNKADSVEVYNTFVDYDTIILLVIHTDEYF